MIQRAFDILCASIGLLILSPMFVVVACVIKLDSPGSVLFRGPRAGKDGQVFHMLKFRSMVQNAASMGPGVTSSGDPRITRVGRWLRRTKVDELPQLWNVFRGDMSLVGPRPEDPRFVALYTERQRRILKIRPGITSPASIQFRDEEAQLPAGEMEAYINKIMPAKIEADLQYFDKRTFWSDLSVLLGTFIRLVR